MLSLSLGDSRIFFVWEMKFPYKKIFHTQKKCGDEKVASIFKEGKRVLNLRDYQYFVCLSKSIIS